MITRVNKEGADWIVAKRWLREQIEKRQEEMLAILSPEEYHARRGAILMAREMMEWVEPTTPPKTTEDDYGSSDPNSEFYK
jgi:hypothetical protein